MPDVIWTTSASHKDRHGVWSHAKIDDTDTSYTRTDLLKQRAKVAVNFIRYQHAEFGVGAIHARDEQLIDIITAALKGELK